MMVYIHPLKLVSGIYLSSLSNAFETVLFVTFALKHGDVFSAESFHKDMLKYMAVQVITMCYGSQKDIFLLCLVNEGVVTHDRLEWQRNDISPPPMDSNLLLWKRSLVL